MQPKELSQCILSLPNFIPALTKNNQLKIGRDGYTKQSFPPFLLGLLQKHIRSLPAAIGSVLSLPHADFKSFAQEVYEELHAPLLAELVEVMPIQTDLTPIDFGNLASLIPVMDVYGQEVRMYNNEKRRLSPMSYDYWKAAADKAVVAERTKHFQPGIFEYSPFSRKTLTKMNVDGFDVNHFNSHIPAPWRALKASDDKLPPLAKKFFGHLFPDPECREFVYCWMYHMLKGRARTFLYLPAAQGVGKTTFAYICSALVGTHNTEIAKSDFAENKFNAFVTSKRLIVLDEFNCWATKEKETLKRVINDKIQVEAKGVDQRTVKNYCSFIICNNNPEGVALDPVDRRFSVPETTKIKMTKLFSAEELDFLNHEHEKEQSQFIADIGHWILSTFKNKVKYERDYAWQSRRFEEVVHASAREGYKYAIDQILSKKSKSYSYAKLRNDYRTLISKNSPFPPYFKVREYFENFKINGERICRIKGGGVSMELIPTREYTPEETDNELEES